MLVIEMLDPAVCLKARLARDARFDGQFFIGVLTTGIYCRPVCPANSPHEKNVRYFPTAAAAAAAGLRPCLRCRPETAPGSPAWNGTSAIVTRALRLINEGALDEQSVDDFAARLGIGSRHLRRLFDEFVGASPVEVAQTRRLHFAKRLIDETEMPLGEVAFAAGYESLRRFHATFQKVYNRPPRELRRDREENPGQGEYRFKLQYRPPYAWNAIATFLASRAIAGVERVDQNQYQRYIRLGEHCGSITVRPLPKANTLELRVAFPDGRRLLEIIERVRRLFDLNAEPQGIAGFLLADPLLKRVWTPGIRVPGAWDGFEVAVRAIVGQQISVKGASTLMSRLVERYGDRVAGGEGRVFPQPETLACADIERMPQARAEAIRRLSAAIAEGSIRLDGAQSGEEVVERLKELPGVGAWTAEYIRMRALGDPDAFLAGDLVLQRATGIGSAKELEQRAEAWRPWRAYAAVAIWQSTVKER
jgi:AraC family transcriptional regulator of adaptative response / DNA-3-methyladenine glycosylase II